MKEDLMDSDFEQIKKDEVGTIYDDWVEGDYRCLIMRGNNSLCAYVGVKEHHILYGIDHDEIDINCHFGLTYSKKGKGELFPKGYWWFGWDYVHLTDQKLDDDYPRDGDLAWTPKWVKTEFPEVLDSFRETGEKRC